MASAPEPADLEDYDPFSDADLQKILHEEKSNSRDEGWVFLNKTDLHEVWKKTERDKPVHLIKGFLYFPGVPPDKIFEMIHNLEIRKEWDKQFPVIDVIETHKHYRVVYWRISMPPGVADRDLVQNIGKRYDEATNSTFLLYRNASHPSRPPRSGIVRAETILSGVVIRPDSEDANSTRMSVLLQNDAKGWIPHFIVNAFAARAPGNWRTSLAKYYHEVYSKRQVETDTGTAEADPGP